jgi:hypothetical protein
MELWCGTALLQVNLVGTAKRLRKVRNWALNVERWKLSVRGARRRAAHHGLQARPFRLCLQPRSALKLLTFLFA